MAEQELDLVNKVELRIALADTDLKFQASLDTYLAPLLLKLASPHSAVRQEIFKFIQHLVTRINSTRVSLPVIKLIQQAKAPKLPSNAVSPTSVQLYSLLFAAKGIDALGEEFSLELLSIVIKDMNKIESPAVQARMFHILLLLLKYAPKVYGDREEERDELRSKLQISDEDERFLCQKFEVLLMIDSSKGQEFAITKGFTCGGVTPSEVNFFSYDAGVSLKLKDLYLYKLYVSRFLMIFKPQNTTLCVIIGSLDVDVDVHRLNTSNMRYISIPIDDKVFIDRVINYFVGDPFNQRPPSCGLYQFEFLERILCRSPVAFDSERVSDIIKTVLSGGSDPKKYSSIYPFIRNVVTLSKNPSHKSTDFLQSIASQLKNKIQSKGWPKADISPGAFYIQGVTERNKQYELLGEVLSKDPRLLEDLKYMVFLFDSLLGESDDVRSSVRDALSSISAHVNKLPEESKSQLKNIIRNHLKDSFTDNQQTLAEVRSLSLKLLNAALPFNDAEAKLLNVLGTSPKNRHDVIYEAKAGLNPYDARHLQHLDSKENKTTSELLGSSTEALDFIDFEQYTTEVQKALEYAELRPTSTIHTVLDTLFNVGLFSIVSNAVKGKTTSVIQDEEWESRILRALSCDPSVISETTKEISRLSKLNSKPVVKFLKLTLKEYVKCFNPTHPFNPSGVSEYIPVLMRLSPANDIGELVEFIPALLDILKKNENLQDKAAVSLPEIIGILTSHHKCNDKHVSEIVSGLLSDYKSDSKKKRSSLLISILGEIIQDLYSRQRLNSVTADDLGFFYSVVNDELKSTSSTSTKVAASVLAGLLKYGAFGPVINDNIVTDLEKYKTEILETLLKSLNRFGFAGFHSLALSTLSEPESIEEDLTPIEKKLVEAFDTKDIDILFSIGESLSIVGSGWESKLLLAQSGIQDDSFSTNTLPREGARLSAVLNHLFNMAKQTKPSIRRAACVWILSLLQYCDKSKVIIENASKIHMVFMRFLTDSDDVIQDSASRGLGLVYDLGDMDLKETLVKSLLRSFADSTSGNKLLSGAVDRDTELFEPGVLKTHDGSVSTYKDILSLASEVGDPSLVYKFMSLAKTSALWSSRRGIAFGLGNVMSKASLSKLLVEDKTMAKRLIPKLFRYRFDPNSLVSQSMIDIWKTLIPDSSNVIDAYSDVILDELLSSMGKTEWRVRQAATAALTDLLQTLPSDKYEDRIEEIWTMGFRALDDIKETVRKAGGNLTRSLSKTLIHSIKNDSGSERAGANIARLLPFLLGPKGISSDSDDVRDFALQTLVSLIKSVGKVIKPFVGELIEQFIMLMSTLEPQIMNYLALNAKKYKVESDLIDSRRVQSLSSSPIMDSIERLIDLSDEENIEEVVSKLRSSIKGSVGLPSKFAGSKIMVSLVLRHYHIIKPYGDVLLTTCSARLNDNNNTVSSAYAVAAGYICRLASLPAVIKYSKKLQTLYFGSENTPSTTRSKQTAGIASQAVSKHSGERFSEVATAFLPVAFICKNDEVEEVAKPFELEWSENTSGVGAVKLYIQEIVDLAIKYIDSTDYSVRKVIVKSISKGFDLMESFNNEKVLDALFKALTGATRSIHWNGKEHLLAALVSVSLKSSAYFQGHQDVFENVKKAVIKAAQSSKKSYVEHTIQSLGLFVKAFPSDSIYKEAIPCFVKRLDLLNTPPNSNHSDMDSDEEMEDADKAKSIKATINERSTQQNLAKEKAKIDALKSLSYCFQVYGTSKAYHQSTLLLILAHLKESFSSDVFEPTWRTNLGIVECFNAVCTVLLESSAVNSDQETIDMLLQIWSIIIKNNFKKDTIENVKIQSIRVGKILLSLKIEKISSKIGQDLISLESHEISSIVKVEIKNALATSIS